MIIRHVQYGHGTVQAILPCSGCFGKINPRGPGSYSTFRSRRNGLESGPAINSCDRSDKNVGFVLRVWFYFNYFYNLVIRTLRKGEKHVLKSLPVFRLPQRKHLAVHDWGVNQQGGHLRHLCAKLSPGVWEEPWAACEQTPQHPHYGLHCPQHTSAGDRDSCVGQLCPGTITPMPVPCQLPLVIQLLVLSWAPAKRQVCW